MIVESFLNFSVESSKLQSFEFRTIMFNMHKNLFKILV